MKKLALLCLLLLQIACNTNDDPGDIFINCTEVFVFGLEVQVKDASTNSIILEPVTVIATDGDYIEELVFNFDRYVGAGERAGTYTITVSSDGYQTKTLDPITVTEDPCHVFTQSVEVALTPN